MQIMNPDRWQTLSIALLCVLGLWLSSCAVHKPLSRHTYALTPAAHATQAGRLTVIATDRADGGPLQRATVEIVIAGSSAGEPAHFRKIGVADRLGRVRFTDVPPVVNISITHERGSYSRDNFAVPQIGETEISFFVDTYGPRSAQDCLGYGLCGN